MVRYLLYIYSVVPARTQFIKHCVSALDTAVYILLNLLYSFSILVIFYSIYNAKEKESRQWFCCFCKELVGNDCAHCRVVIIIVIG